MPRQSSSQARRVPPPCWLDGDDGSMLLAATKGVALREAREYAPLDHITDVTFAGWMHDVGWDRDNYERKRDFIAESGYTSWWENGAPPSDRQVTAKSMPGWEIVYCAGCDECAED